MVDAKTKGIKTTTTEKYQFTKEDKKKGMKKYRTYKTTRTQLTRRITKSLPNNNYFPCELI